MPLKSLYHLLWGILDAYECPLNKMFVEPLL
uniref:Uncharacterized protein n=1 Tax=Arundo donax TaxID=35708 RepID=A0A0A9G7U0_ARUDO